MILCCWCSVGYMIQRCCTHSSLQAQKQSLAELPQGGKVVGLTNAGGRVVEHFALGADTQWAHRRHMAIVRAARLVFLAWCRSWKHIARSQFHLLPTALGAKRNKALPQPGPSSAPLGQSDFPSQIEEILTQRSVTPGHSHLPCSHWNLGAPEIRIPRPQHQHHPPKL